MKTPVEELEIEIQQQWTGVTPPWLKGFIEQAKNRETEFLENLKDFDTWKEWKNNLKSL